MAIDRDRPRRVREAASGRWVGVLGQLAPSLDRALAKRGRHVPCPVHGGTDGFRVFKDVNYTGGGICNTCGAYTDGFALLMWVNDWTFPEVLDAVEKALGLDLAQGQAVPAPRRAPPPVAPAAASNPDAEAALRRVWAETYDPTAPEARPLQRYLARRGIDAEPDPRIIRFHPGLGYWEEQDDETWVRRGTYPAIVARVADAQGKPVSLHRIYLTPEGHKAPVRKPKKMMPPKGPVLGGAIRLFPAGSTLAITEGIETALVIRQRTMMPIWAGVSATLMERFQPPPGVETLIVWGDLDRSGRGEEAACTLQNRMVEQGVRACVHLPKGPIPENAKGLDWADLWRLKDLEVL